MRLSTPGIVIRDYKYEDNRILTILTEAQGVLTAFANSASRPRSALAGSTELLCYSDFVLFHSKGNYYVNNADSINLFFKLRSRFEDLSLASYFAQLSEELAPSQENATPYVQLLLGCLHYLENQQRPPKQLKAIMELRILTLSGYMPDLVGCRVCGTFEGTDIFFTPDGDLICKECKGKAESSRLVLLPPGVLAAMRHIIYSELKKVFSFTLSDEGFNILGKISEDYLIFQLEKTLPTLEFYRGLNL